jgi:hypothetical protein
MGVDKRDPRAPAPHPPPIHPSSPHLMVCKLWRRRHRCRMGPVLALALPRERGGGKEDGGPGGQRAGRRTQALISERQRCTARADSAQVAAVQSLPAQAQQR